MRRHVLTTLFSTAVVLANCAAYAGGATFYAEGKTYTLSVALIEKLEVSEDDGREGHYVFIASAQPNGQIETGAIEDAASCTGVRPHFGMTQPSDGGFTTSAYAAYYGPYETRRDARAVRAAAASCVHDAFIRSGVIKRY